VKPDCCGRRRAVSSGWSLASRTLANTFHSRHSAGTRSVFHTREQKMERDADWFLSVLISSGWVPSEPAARPFFNFRIGCLTSPSVGASSGTVRSGTARAASESRSFCFHGWKQKGHTTVHIQLWIADVRLSVRSFVPSGHRKLMSCITSSIFFRTERFSEVPQCW